MLIELVDGGIMDIAIGNKYMGGPGFGCLYVDLFKIDMYTVEINVSERQIYECALEYGLMGEIILNNEGKIREMTEKEFAEWIDFEMRQLDGDLEINIIDKRR